MRPLFQRYGTDCCAEQVDTTEGCPKLICLPSRVLHISWSYGVGPKVEMRLFWIAYVLTLFDLSSHGYLKLKIFLDLAYEEMA